MKKHGLLIFDLDGTLFRTETVTVPAVRQGFNDLNLPVPRTEDIHSFFGKPADVFNHWIRSQYSPDKANELIDSIERRELELISETGELYPGVREVLKTLRKATGHMALYSNGPENYVEHVVDVHRLQEFFDAVRYRRSDQDSKHTMVRELLERLESRPAIVIGDRYEDIDAAKRHKLFAIAAKYGYGAGDDLGSADAEASSPSDLEALALSLLAHKTDQTGSSR